MLVNEVMTRGVQCVNPDTTLQEAASKMKEMDIGPLPVCENGRLVGMITDRDITVRSVSEGNDPWTDKVRDSMTRAIIYCYEDDDVAVAARLMKENQVRRLVALDRDKRLTGIVSLGDLAVKIGGGGVSSEALEYVSGPAESRR